MLVRALECADGTERICRALRIVFMIPPSYWDRLINANYLMALAVCCQAQACVAAHCFGDT